MLGLSGFFQSPWQNQFSRVTTQYLMTLWVIYQKHAYSVVNTKRRSSKSVAKLIRPCLNFPYLLRQVPTYLPLCFAACIILIIYDIAYFILTYKNGLLINDPLKIEVFLCFLFERPNVLNKSLGVSVLARRLQIAG